MVDNLSDALYMAAAILIFIVALTVSMSSFSEMKTQVDEIIESDSKIDLVTDNSGNYLNYETAVNNGDVRIVGAETVVSSMYRVAKEKYDVFIKFKNNDYPTGVKTTEYADLEKDKTGTRDRVISRQQYKVKQNDGTEQYIDIPNSFIVITVDGGRDTIKGDKKTLDDIMKSKGLYNSIKRKKI